MLSAAVDESALPNNQLCAFCCDNAILWCRMCGPVAYFCEKCFLKQHEKVNLFHVPERWEVSMDINFTPWSKISVSVKVDVGPSTPGFPLFPTCGVPRVSTSPFL